MRWLGRSRSHGMGTAYHRFIRYRRTTIFDLPRSCDQSPIPHRNGLSTNFSSLKRDIKEHFEGSKRDRDKKGLVLARAELTWRNESVGRGLISAHHCISLTRQRNDRAISPFHRSICALVHQHPRTRSQLLYDHCSIPPLQAPVCRAPPGPFLKLVLMLQSVRDFPHVSRVSGHFLTFPPFYIVFKQALDAYKSLWLTPSNGPDPPSNISDKIAQSRQANGPADWLHSRCPTRAKPFELRTTLPSL